MTQESIAPTPERIAKNRHWDQPEVDSKTNRKASRVVDDITFAWRHGKLEFAHFQAWEHFQRHWEGAQKHDVRVTDATGSPSEADDRMPPWQYHGFKMAEARSTLTPDQFLALELMTQGWGFREVGLNFSPYRSRQAAEPYALGMVHASLDTLAFLWSLKVRQKVPIR